ncbi:uncharacterized protein LOC126741611 isoform X1 [Anthonomus grandis grandis]|uniref:uncharacterized protein LOC126741611 isoform X1 n=1 Tax=Anthonomus grandis grandis TaxID=2921223 RepID=UPI002166A78B|nr:uncharacterized protein LOC126741611 isoform X1 [Anthonomus grandis grandis]
MNKDFIARNPDITCNCNSFWIILKKKNISFTKLGHEECELCEIFENDEHGKENLDPSCEICQKYTIHSKKAEQSRALYKEDANKINPKNEVYYSADLQKVIMLPRMESYKIAIFTQRIIAFNQSFVPVGTNQKNLRPIAAIWHEGIAGRKKEDLIRAFHQFFLNNRDAIKITLWLDNCAAQNKNWTMLSYLVYIINSGMISAQKIFIKYFGPGHTFMSADSFHNQVELQMKYKKNIYDFPDFKEAVGAANSSKTRVIDMNIHQFYDWLDLTSINRIKKLKPRPYISDFTTLMVKQGSKAIFYTENYDYENIKTLEFLKIKSEKEPISLPGARNQPRGINPEKKSAILKKLCFLMSTDRQIFCQEIPENTLSRDLNTSID